MRNNDKCLTMEILDHELVWKLVADINWDWVVCEGFDAQYISKYGLATVRIIGGVQAICWYRKLKIHIPKSGDRIPYIQKARAKLVEIHGKLPVRDHQESAMAHLLRFEKEMI